MFDLSAKDFRTLMQILLSRSEILERVILFGSRARKDNQAHSDIDLAVQYKKNSALSNTTLSEAFESSDLPYTVDIVDLSLEKETKLKTFIQNEGVVLFDAASKNVGEQWMTIATLQEKLADFKSALSRLDEALAKNIQSDSLYLDATIQRFEFTYELAWKLMKAYLRHLGIDVNNPRSAIRESIKQNIISDHADWFQMIDERNNTTHTYHEAIALSVYAAVKSRFIQLLHEFEKKIVVLMGELK